MRASLDGTRPRRPLAHGQDQPQGIAVNGNYVYWSILGDQDWRDLPGQPGGRLQPPGLHRQHLGRPQLLAFTPPRLGFTPSPYDFGEVRTREAATQSFTLANSGGLATGPLTVTPEGAAAFTTTGGTCTGTSLAQGASCTVTASFGPTSFGAVTATLTAASQTSPLPGATATAALTGTGVGHLYWVNQGQAATDGSVNLANPDGTNAVTLTNPGTLPFPQGVAVNANLLYVSVRGDLDNDPDFEPFILGAENDNLVSTARVFVFQATGQDAQVPQQLAINANNPNDLFWKSGDGTIWRGNINDGSFQNIFPQQPTQARGMTVNANYVYWCTSRALQGDGTIWRANLVGTNPVQLAQNLDAPQGLAVERQLPVLGQRRQLDHAGPPEQRLYSRDYRHRPERPGGAGGQRHSHLLVQLRQQHNLAGQPGGRPQPPATHLRPELPGRDRGRLLARGVGGGSWTRRRSTRPQGCWTTRTTGRSAG